MGRAIIRQPQVFLMDEPLSNLDAQLRVHMRGEIEALQKRLGVTTVYVTHDQVEAMTMGDRVAVLRDGRASAGGHADERLRPAGEPLRRRLHRLAADEPRAGHDRAGDGGLVVPLGETTIPLRVAHERPGEVGRADGRSSASGPRISTGLATAAADGR